jgi:TRAP-type C4-dicarboxylate transport system substrate-binding protein
MKKILGTLFTIILLLSATACNTTADGEEKIIWRLGHEENPGEAMDLVAQKFAEEVDRLSDGRIEIDIFRIGEIGGVFDYMEYLQDGLFQFALHSPATTSSVVPEHNMFNNHFILPSDDFKVQELLETSEAMQYFNDLTAERNMYVHGWFMTGWNTWTTNRYIRSPEDARGFRMRTMPSTMIIESYRAYGMNPTPMPYLEVFSGLQLRQIDGQTNPIFAIEQMRFYEVQNYIIKAYQDAFINMALANLDFMEELSQEEREIVDIAWQNAIDYGFEMQAELNSGRLQNIRDNSDITIIELTEEERAVFIEAAQPVREIFKRTISEESQRMFELFLEESERIQQGKDGN